MKARFYMLSYHFSITQMNKKRIEQLLATIEKTTEELRREIGNFVPDVSHKWDILISDLELNHVILRRLTSHLERNHPGVKYVSQLVQLGYWEGFRFAHRMGEVSAAKIIASSCKAGVKLAEWKGLRQSLIRKTTKELSKLNLPTAGV
jgi:hypothetical protein